MRRAVRTLLTVLLLGSGLWTAWNAWHLLRSPQGAWLVDRSAVQLGAAYDRAVARTATPEALSQRMVLRLAESPRNWVAIDALVDLAQAQGTALPPGVEADLAAARAEDFGLVAGTRACAACALDLRHCPLSPALGCGVAINLTVLGDLTALGRESSNHMRGVPVDQVDVVLSFIGLGATGLAVASGGTSLSVKAGAALIRTAHRMGRLSPGMIQVFTRGFRQGVDWARVPVARSADDLTALARPAALRPASDAAQSLGQLHRTLGTGPTLHLMRHIDTPLDARRIARGADALGPRTVGAFEVMGKSRFLRAGMRLADEVWYMIAGMVAVITALAGLIATMAGSGVLRCLRRAARPARGST